MRKADISDKDLVVGILTESFEDNKSVNYVIKQDRFRLKRIRMLMEYSFDVCHRFGDIYISDDRHACALILYPDKKQPNLKALLLDIRFIINCVGISRIFKILKREHAIKKKYSTKAILYLWFIGVRPAKSNQGIGSQLLSDIIDVGKAKRRPIYLETSMTGNLSFYKKHGFELYHEMTMPHQLFFMRKNRSNN